MFAVVAMVVLASVALGQACPCSQSTGPLSPAVVLDSPGFCVEVMTAPVGCVCDMDGPMMCDTDSNAVAYEFTVGSECVPVPKTIALCPETRVVEFGPCVINASVPYDPQLDCTVAASAFPPGATVTAISATIEQADEWTFEGAADDAITFPDWTVEYQTINEIFPLFSFAVWPATPNQVFTGTFSGSDTVVINSGTDLFTTVVDALPAGLTTVNTNLAAAADTVFSFGTFPGTYTENFDDNLFDPIQAYTKVTLSVEFVV